MTQSTMRQQQLYDAGFLARAIVRIVCNYDSSCAKAMAEVSYALALNVGPDDGALINHFSCELDAALDRHDASLRQVCYETRAVDWQAVAREDAAKHGE